MAGEYSALQVLVTANSQRLAQEIAKASTQAGDQASQTIGSKISAGLGKVASGIGKPLSTGFAVAAAGAGAFLAATISAGKSYNILAQNSNVAFKSVLGSQQAATAMMDRIAAFAKTTPFPRQVWIEAATTMTSFGISTDKSTKYMAALADAAAATGTGTQGIKDMALKMSQISAAGKITATDLMQFAQRGVNAADLIGSQMGKTGAQIKDEITAGSLDANKALDALAAGIEEKCPGPGQNMVQTL